MTNIKMIYWATMGLWLLLAQVSCSPERDEEKEIAFKQLFPSVNMNQEITFQVPTENYFIGDCLDLTLENLSTEKIIFESDYGINIFAYDGKDWVEISNSVQYMPPGNRQISPKGVDSPGIIGIGLCPELENENKSIAIRVVVTSIDASVSSSVQIGAFVDVILLP